MLEAICAFWLSKEWTNAWGTTLSSKGYNGLDSGQIHVKSESEYEKEVFHLNLNFIWCLLDPNTAKFDSDPIFYIQIGPESNSNPKF